MNRLGRNILKAPLVLFIRLPLVLLCNLLIIPLSRRVEEWAHWLIAKLPGFE